MKTRRKKTVNLNAVSFCFDLALRRPIHLWANYVWTALWLNRMCRRLAHKLSFRFFVFTIICKSKKSKRKWGDKRRYFRILELYTQSCDTTRKLFGRTEHWVCCCRRFWCRFCCWCWVLKCFRSKFKFKLNSIFILRTSFVYYILEETRRPLQPFQR